MGEIVRTTAHLDAPRAARIFDGYPVDADPSEAALAVEGFIGVWSDNDPRGAAEFANGLANEALRRVALAQATARWAETEADAARVWLSSLPASGARDAALAQPKLMPRQSDNAAN